MIKLVVLYPPNRNSKAPFPRKASSPVILISYDILLYHEIYHII